jgi:rubrerythrin
MVDEKVIEQLRTWIEVEEEVVYNIGRVRAESEGTIPSLLLYELVADSTKHINILNAIIDILEGRFKESTGNEVSYDFIKDHIETEKTALQFADRLRRETDNEDVKLLLSHIMEEEQRHHDTLIHISERYVKEA